MSHKVIAPAFERNDGRGLFQEVLNEGSWESLVRGRMKPGAVMGNHYHKHTVIFFYIVRGEARITTVNVETGEKDRFVLESGRGVMLMTNESHAINFTEESEFILLKSLRYCPEDPDTYHYPVED